MDAHSHRPSGLKQSNKPFKSRHSSKGAIKDRNKGKVNRPQQQQQSGGSKEKLHHHTKADRRNAARLRQQAKRQELQLLQRSVGGSHGAPKLVAVVSLCPDVESTRVLDMIVRHAASEASPPEGDMDVDGEGLPYGPRTVRLDRWKQRVTFFAVPRDIYDVLEAAKVADFLAFCYSPEEEVDEFGDLVISCVMAQGLPSVVNVVVGLSELPPKRHAPILKSLSSYASQFFGDDKQVFPADTETDVGALLRHISQRIPRSMSWRSNHPYMLVDQWKATPAESMEDRKAGFATLKATGYIRGKPWSVHRLVHVSGCGVFQLGCIEITSAHKSSQGQNAMQTDSDAAAESNSSFRFPNPELQDELTAENVPDPLANEMTWPTEEELADAEEQEARLRQLASGKRKKVRVPKGTSSYQAAWIVESDEEEEDDDSEKDDEDDDNNDDGSQSAAMMIAGDGESEDGDSEEYEEVELEERHSEEDGIDAEDTEENLQQYLKQRAQMSRDDFVFPDEVDTPVDTPARVRFAKYRGLKSFRTSPWDPMENLPLEYAKIFDFEDYNRTRRRVLNDDDGDNRVAPYTRVTLHIKRVSAADVDALLKLPFVAIFSMLEYEQKTSVLHYVVTRNGAYEAPVQSKDELILVSGYRMLRAKPIYSQYSKENKHKFERFLQPGATAVASIYGPIQFPPSPVLFFKDNGPGKVPSLVATGSLMEVRPQRIIAKRIILTGDVFKVHKKVITVRYMFFNPEDVHWFRTVQLRTKSGRTGNIKESLGTHGYMKCVFDGRIKSDDVVCMHLYKRVYPPWKALPFTRHAPIDMQ